MLGPAVDAVGICLSPYLSCVCFHYFASGPKAKQAVN